MHDLHNNIEVRRAISPVRSIDNTPMVSQIIDTANRDSLEFAIAIGTLTDADATFAVTMDEGDAANLSDASAVAAADLLGTLAGAGFTFSSDDQVRKIGYIGDKRYVRLTITPSNHAASTADIAVLALLGGARKLPLSSQS